MSEIQDKSDRRWDMHTERQIAIAKAGALAVTVLNSGSWLALLSQASALQEASVGYALGAWGAGALLGTLIWMCIFNNAIAQMNYDFDRTCKSSMRQMERGKLWGYIVSIGSLVCFTVGVIALAMAFV